MDQSNCHISLFLIFFIQYMHKKKRKKKEKKVRTLMYSVLVFLEYVNEFLRIIILSVCVVRVSM